MLPRMRGMRALYTQKCFHHNGRSHADQEGVTEFAMALLLSGGRLLIDMCCIGTNGLTVNLLHFVKQPDGQLNRFPCIKPEAKISTDARGPSILISIKRESQSRVEMFGCLLRDDNSQVLKDNYLGRENSDDESDQGPP
ncbi:hypothetical protein CEXT_254751 [Caerostris extrusa]|uniref:Uncharacterized protein n=1 Tax=Caerostris extrusa TaxID=172846 RepID=A0AAV4Q185_CAEEX|nr:hypothetical protein CEXT_254751 [Caerostris extrusa]